MYSIIPRSPTAQAVLVIIAIVIVLIVYANGNQSLLGFVIGASAAALPAMAALYLLCGLSASCAPWRILWKTIPALNEAVFPDINGMWVGEIKSNFPVKRRMAEGALNDGEFDLAELEKIDLQAVRMVMEIKSSFFSVSFRAAVAGVKDGTSESVVVRLEKGKGFVMHYIYKQTTPEPGALDESSHPGSASVAIEYSRDAIAFSGHYWNLRRWRHGLNNAGRISMTRVSTAHEDPAKLLSRL